MQAHHCPVAADKLAEMISENPHLQQVLHE